MTFSGQPAIGKETNLGLKKSTLNARTLKDGDLVGADSELLLERCYLFIKMKSKTNKNGPKTKKGRDKLSLTREEILEFFASLKWHELRALYHAAIQHFDKK